MMGTRTIALTGALGLAGLGLIGTGAHAIFTTSGSASQTINAGTISIALYNASSSGCTAEIDGCNPLTLPTLGPEGSTFSSGGILITAANSGTVNLTETSLGAVATGGGSFLSEADVCIVNMGNLTPLYNGSLGSIPASLTATKTLNPYPASGSTDAWGVWYYAGTESPPSAPFSGCTATTPSLTNSAAGEGATLTLTLNGNG